MHQSLQRFPITPIFAWVYPDSNPLATTVPLVMALGVAWGVWLFFRKWTIRELLAFVAFWAVTAVLLAQWMDDPIFWKMVRGESIGL